jgi:hypothetical protein
MSAKNPAPPKIFCSQKSAKNPIQKLPKNPLKILQLKNSYTKNLLLINKDLTKNN